jgi:hypothetical protein
MRELSHYPPLGELEQPIGLVEGAQDMVDLTEYLELLELMLCCQSRWRLRLNVQSVLPFHRNPPLISLRAV